MRQNELSGGIELRDEKGERACKSKSSAVKGIAQVKLLQPLIILIIIIIDH